MLGFHAFWGKQKRFLSINVEMCQTIWVWSILLITKTFYNVAYVYNNQSWLVHTLFPSYYIIRSCQTVITPVYRISFLSALFLFFTTVQGHFWPLFFTLTFGHSFSRNLLFEGENSVTCCTIVSCKKTIHFPCFPCYSYCHNNFK